MAESVEVRSGAYHDSVTLMQVSREVDDRDDVEAVLVAMATPLNLDLLAGMGFTPPDAGPNDLLVAVRAADEDALVAAVAATDAALTAGHRRGENHGEVVAPRTPAAAATLGADLALISVPGEHAFVEALDALRAGMHVMVFSDNVAVAHEVVLKREAAERGLLVMGPDCGTAMVAGLGLGFVNVLRAGPVGLVAASGTGAQHLTCLLDDAGLGVSHVLGVGGRDLSAEVSGAATRQALAALDADPATELIVVLSKPPAAEVADQVRAAAAGLDTAAVVGFVGRGEPDLTALAATVLAARGLDAPTPRTWPASVAREPRRRTLRGLFAGGTLCDEAMAVAAEVLGPIRSNIPLEADWALGDDLDADNHLMIDFGDDRLTAGRPHPMIDQRSRLERIAAEAQRPDDQVLLLDVVLGHAAHPDPAADLAPALEQARSAAAAQGHDLEVVVSLCATGADPQDRERQASALVAAGASVHASNAAAAREAAALANGETPS